VDGPQVTKPPQRGRASLWMNYALLLYTAIAFGAVLIAANAILSNHNVRFDLTPDQRFSLSEFDKRVLSGLTHNVKVMAFIRSEDTSYIDLADLLFQAAAFTPRLTYQIIDVNKAPGLSRQYGVSTYGEVVVESQGRRRDFDNERSDLLIPAVLQISADAQKPVYFTIGHGERDIYDTDKNAGFTEWRQLLEQNNYRIENISLFAGGVPDDAKLVVALAPRKDFLPEELAELRKYLARGGHLMVMLDPFGSPTLAQFLEQYHMRFTDRVIVDPAYRLTAGEILTTQIPLRAEDNPISRAMAAPGVFSLARGVLITADVGAPAPDWLQVAETSEFLRSSHESWASADPKAVASGITDFEKGRDNPGPVPVGAEVDLAPAAKPHIPVLQMTRIVGFGSSTFCTNQFIGMLGNRDLAVSVVNELVGDEMLIVSRERLVKSAGAAFYVTEQQTRRLLFLSAVVEPMLLFLIGATVFVRRRFFA